jgi:hypothetical protein
VFDVSKREGVWSRNYSHEVVTRTSIPCDINGKKEQQHEFLLEELVKIGGGFSFFF